MNYHMIQKKKKLHILPVTTKLEAKSNKKRG